MSHRDRSLVVQKHKVSRKKNITPYRWLLLNLVTINNNVNFWFLLTITCLSSPFAILWFSTRVWKVIKISLKVFHLESLGIRRKKCYRANNFGLIKWALFKLLHELQAFKFPILSGLSHWEIHHQFRGFLSKKKSSFRWGNIFCGCPASSWHQWLEPNWSWIRSRRKWVIPQNRRMALPPTPLAASLLLRLSKDKPSGGQCSEGGVSSVGDTPPRLLHIALVRSSCGRGSLSLVSGCDRAGRLAANTSDGHY